MGKREEERRQADRNFEEIRRAIAAQSDEWLCDALRDVPHRKWIEIGDNTHMAVGILAHRAAQRIAELTRTNHDESQCWEPCGELGKSEQHARVATETGECQHDLLKPGTTIEVIDQWKARCNVCIEFFDISRRASSETGEP